jgi:hypothetical protein
MESLPLRFQCSVGSPGPLGTETLKWLKIKSKTWLHWGETASLPGHFPVQHCARAAFLLS